MQLGMSEILEKVSELPSKKEKIDFLRKHDNIAFKMLLKMAYDKNLKWELPEGDPPYKPAPYDDMEGMLYQEVKKLYLFHRGGNLNLKQLRREQLFIQLLESIMPRDAALLLAVKNKKLPYKGVDEKIIGEAYPGLLVY